MRGDTALPPPRTERGGHGEEPGPLLERIGLLAPDPLEGEVDPPHILGEEEPGPEGEVGLGRHLAGLERERKARTPGPEADREPRRAIDVGVELAPEPTLPGVARTGPADVAQRL